MVCFIIHKNGLQYLIEYLCSPTVHLEQMANDRLGRHKYECSKTKRIKKKRHEKERSLNDEQQYKVTGKDKLKDYDLHIQRSRT